MSRSRAFAFVSCLALFGLCGCAANKPVAPVAPAPASPQTVTAENYRPMTMAERYIEKASRLLNSGQAAAAAEALEMALLIDPASKDARAMLERIRPNTPETVKPEPEPAPEPEPEPMVAEEEIAAEPEPEPVVKDELVVSEPAPEPEPEPAPEPEPEPEPVKPEPAVVPEPEPEPEETIELAAVSALPSPEEGAGRDDASLQLSGLGDTQDLTVGDFTRKIMEDDFVFGSVADDITKYLYKEYLHERSVEVYLRAIERFPDSPNVPRALLYIGMFYSRKEKYDEALKYFSRILDEHSRAQEVCAVAQYEIAGILFLREEYKKAYGMLTEILNTSVTYSLLGRVYMLRGAVMSAMGQWKKGLSDYQAVIKLGDHTRQFDDAVIAVAREMIKHGRENEAVSHLEFYMNKTDMRGRGRVAMLLASVYHKAGDMAGEKKVVMDFLAMPRIERADRVRAMYMLGDCFFRLEDWENAYNTYNTALREYYDKNSAMTALYRKGLCAARIGFYKDALSAFDDVIARSSYSSEWVRSKFERAAIYRQQNNDAAAAVDLKDVITFARDEGLVLRAYEGLGALFAAQGRHKDAVFLYNKALGTFRSSPGAILSLKIDLAYSLKEDGQPETALETIESVGEDEFDGRDRKTVLRYMDALAVMLFENGLYPRSLKTYESIRNMLDDEDERVPAVLYSMGRCRELMGDKKEAVASYQELIRAYPASLASEQAQWNIKNIKWQADYSARERI